MPFVKNTEDKPDMPERHALNGAALQLGAAGEYDFFTKWKKSEQNAFINSRNYGIMMLVDRS